MNKFEVVLIFSPELGSQILESEISTFKEYITRLIPEKSVHKWND